MIITHPVADVDHWLKPEHKQERAAAITEMGGKNARDFVAQDGSNAIAVIADVDAVDALLAALASPSPEHLATMEKHGVQTPFAVYIEK
jgi:intracellular sulfur oxidation DsrE/DsrF family protein